MRDFLKRYTLIMETSSPVFIGSGEKISKKEYIFNGKENKVYIPNIGKMYHFLKDRNLLKSYQGYLLNDNRDFAYWLQSQGIKKSDYMPWILYSLDSGDAVFEQRGKKEILTFQKDAYGQPYIPGSSIKGFFRTALLHNGIQQWEERELRQIGFDIKKAERKGRNSYLLRESKDMEMKYFYTLDKEQKRKNNAVNDCMSGLRVSDSKPLSIDDLVLCQKIDVNIEGSEHKMPLIRECIKPNCTITADITIDITEFSYTIKEIETAVQSFMNMYQEIFAGKYPGKRMGHSGGNMMLLGGGVGYVSKTNTYSVLGESGVDTVSRIIDNTLNYKQKRDHKHEKDKSLGVSPHILKCTKYNAQLYEMGYCSWKITVQNHEQLRSKPMKIRLRRRA